MIISVSKSAERSRLIRLGIGPSSVIPKDAVALMLVGDTCDGSLRVVSVTGDSVEI